ncbi:MAG: hypothetical protein ACKOB6_02810 [Candidatus Kapaibacterium sp.]
MRSRSFVLASVLFVASFVTCLWIVSCSSTTRPEYDYQPSAHIEPDSAYTTGPKHTLNLRLRVQTPSRSCWVLDKALHGSDTDYVAKKRFTYVVASIKKLSSATCLMGLDSVSATLAIPFDNAGVYEVRYPQVDPRGLLIEKTVYYTIP